MYYHYYPKYSLLLEFTLNFEENHCLFSGVSKICGQNGKFLTVHTKIKLLTPLGAFQAGSEDVRYSQWT